MIARVTGAVSREFHARWSFYRGSSRLRDERDAVETIYGLWRNKIYRGYQGNVTKIAVERKRDAHRQAYYVGELANESESGEREREKSRDCKQQRGGMKRERERKHERKEQDE